MRWAAAIVLVFMGFVGAGEPNTTTFTGSYVWSNIPNEPGKLKAVFTPKGDSEYAVSFYFKFDGVNHVYSGTAQGSLQDGNLAGEVKNDNKRRTFAFTGMCKDGAFAGTHSEIRANGERKTGTLTLAKQ